MSEDAGLMAFGMFFLVMGVIVILLSIPYFIGLWNIFKKVGLPGWYCLVPFFGSFMLGNKLLNTDKGGIIYLALDVIPIILSQTIANAAGPAVTIANLFRGYTLAKCFGKSAGWGIFLAFLGPIAYLILGLDKDAQFIGPTDPMT